MSKRWGVWSRLFVVIGVLWTIGFPIVVWVQARGRAVESYAGWQRYCRSQPYVSDEVLRSCFDTLPLTPPDWSLFWEATGVGVGVMLVSIVLFLILRAIIRWILAGRNAA